MIGTHHKFLDSFRKVNHISIKHYVAIITHKQLVDIRIAVALTERAYQFFFPCSQFVVCHVAEIGQDGLEMGCFSTTVGAIRQLLRWCSKTSCSANQSSFSELLCSPSLLPPNRTDSTFFCFRVSSAIPVSRPMLLGLGSESMWGPHLPKLDPLAYWYMITFKRLGYDQLPNAN